MLLKIAVIVFLLVILYCLGSGLYYLIKEGRDSVAMVKALTWRITISITLFLLLLLAYAIGWIAPHGVVVVGS